jgi:hypothetical protein
MASTKVVLKPQVRFSYVHVFEPYAFDDKQAAKYSAVLMIDKTDKANLDAVNAAIQAAIAKGVEKFGATFSAKCKANLPLHSGNEDHPDKAAFKDVYYLNAKSNSKPQVVDRDLNPITEPSELYAGCYGRASLNFAPWTYSNKYGISVYLNNLQKLSEGERLDGSSSAFDDFAE